MRLVKPYVAMLIISGSLCAHSPALSAPPKPSGGSEWIEIARSSDDTFVYSGKAKSFEMTTTKGGVPIAMLLGQTNNIKTITYNKWYVSTSDCENGMGKLVSLKISGEFDFESDYVAKGENNASRIGDTLCSLYRSHVEANEAKGVG